MKGSYTIRIHNRRVTFTLEIERNLTILCGNSATGKTTLVNYVAYYEDLGPKSGVSIESPRPCITLRGSEWQEKLQRNHGCFVFLDEGNSFIHSKDFAQAIQKTDHYYIIITRANLFQLPYSVHSILELRKTTSRFNHTYNHTHPRYDFIPQFDSKKHQLDYYLTEGSNSGYEFFSFLADRESIRCLSSNGKDHILSVLRNEEGQRGLIIADGAAFGASMASVYQYLQMHPKEIILYLPESFEWLILSSGVLQDKETREILSKPENYIESHDYFSWERFFTHLLEEKTRGTIAQYTKRKLNPYYLDDKNVEKIVLRMAGKEDGLANRETN